MSVITGIVNGTNLNQDYHFQALADAILDEGVEKGYKNNLAITTNQCDTGRAFVEATRDNISPSQTFLVPVEVTSAETIDTSGNGYIIIRLADAKINDGSSNAADGSGIATIEKVSSLPSKNYLTLATLASGVITDARTYTAIKDNTDGLLDNIQTLINTTIGAGNWKASVVCATTAAGTLASDFENGDTIDGITLATGDRVLIKDQAAASENGIYTVNASGAPTRATDFDTSAEITSGVTSIEEGTVNADTTWLCTSDDPVIGTDNIDFIKFTTAAQKIINTKSAITTLEDADQFMVADNSDSDNDKKITLANLKNELSGKKLGKTSALRDLYLHGYNSAVRSGSIVTTRFSAIATATSGTTDSSCQWGNSLADIGADFVTMTLKGRFRFNGGGGVNDNAGVGISSNGALYSMFSSSGSSAKEIGIFRTQGAGTLYAFTRNGDNTAKTITAITHADAIFDLEIRKSNTTVEFYIDGVLEATITTNVPTTDLNYINLAAKYSTSGTIVSTLYGDMIIEFSI